MLEKRVVVIDWPLGRCGGIVEFNANKLNSRWHSCFFVQGWGMWLEIFICVLFVGFSSYSLWYGKRSRDNFYAADIQRLTRYIEACQWVASMRVSPYDIDCYSLYRLSESMQEWADETGKNPLEITQFRDYCNWLIGYRKVLSPKEGWVLGESLIDGPIISSVRSSIRGGNL